MCMTRMSTFTADEVVTVTPLRAFPVIKDLVTDVSFNYQKAREIPAFAPPTDLALGEYRMQQVDVERSQEFRKCIECFLCQDTCHVVRDHEENKEAFAGPRFFIRLAELDMHPLDTRDRKREAQAQHGLGMCNITKCCTEVCPEHIKITDNAIIPMKERVVDTQYDPLVWLGNKIPRRSAVAANRALSRGDLSSAEEQARTRLRDKPADRQALFALSDALRAQGRYDEAAKSTRTLVHNAGRARMLRLDALSLHVFVLLCGVEAGQLDLQVYEEEIASTMQQAQRLASTGTILEGKHALHHLVHGRLGNAVVHAREAIVWDRDRPTRADDLVTLSEALAALGEGEEARSALAEAESLWPDNPRLATARVALDAMGAAAAPAR
jgi:succinate dehydrogenase / fumarate reductase iron-sulfur subunit